MHFPMIPGEPVSSQEGGQYFCPIPALSCTISSLNTYLLKIKLDNMYYTCYSPHTRGTSCPRKNTKIGQVSEKEDVYSHHSHINT